MGRANTLTYTMLKMMLIFLFMLSLVHSKTFFCGKYSYNKQIVRKGTSFTFKTKGQTRRCGITFKLNGCKKMLFWCSKFNVISTTGKGYPRCSGLGFLSLSVPPKSNGKRYCNSLPGALLSKGFPFITDQSMKVIYRAGPPMTAKKGVTCSVKCAE